MNVRELPDDWTEAAFLRVYEQYRQARDNGQTKAEIHAEGWCGDAIDLCSDRYFDAEQEYQRAMEEYRDSVLGTGLTMHERELESLPR